MVTLSAVMHKAGKSAKPAKSGLSTITRDWSTSSLGSAPPRSSQPFDWPSTPPVPVAPARKLTGSEARLLAIQEALSGKPKHLPPSAPLARSTAQNKRASPTGGPEVVPAPKKARRILPPDWHANDSLSKPSLSAHQSKPRSRSSSVLSPLVDSPSSSSSAGKTKVAPVFLSQEQTQILKLVQEGESVFYTGSAGTGKSVLLREIIKTLRKKFVKSPDAVAITASTGIAACNIGGVTIHSFAGIGLGIEKAEELASKVRKNKKAATRWARTRVLIVDEVSMVDGDLFDKLAHIASALRKDLRPFGGIQLVVTGDFFQLPPVTKGEQQVKFAFEGSMWKEAVKHTYNLTKVFRQSDQRFIDMLNEMRFGNLSQKSIAMFRSLSRNIEYDDGLGATELFPRREDVERSNSGRMSRLQTEEQSFTSQDGGIIQDLNQREKMLANFMAPQRLVLRVDAQVMLIKNVDETLVNGSMGRVLSFTDAESTEVEQMGAIGATTSSSAKKAPGAAAFKAKMYPLVEFLLPNGMKRRVLVTSDTWKVELPTGEVQVSRTQLPLILAWAMSIHKSQGQTLDRVKVDLGKVFEKGQAYVALSRATSLDRLQVLNFDPHKVQVHPKVVAWSKTLSVLSDA